MKTHDFHIANCDELYIYSLESGIKINVIADSEASITLREEEEEWLLEYLLQRKLKKNERKAACENE